LHSIKAIFFDVGATLLAPAKDEGDTFTQLARELGISINPVEVNQKVPLMYELYEQLYEQDDSFWSDTMRAQAIWTEMYEYMASLLGIPKQRHKELAEVVYQHYFSANAWTPFDDVLPILDLLRGRGIRMGLISNWDSTLVSIIEGLGMSDYFETVIASADVCLHKPMPEIFHLALSHLSVDAQEALHVGDHLKADAQGAAGVGITPLLLDRHERHTAFDGIRIQSLLEIEALLQ